MVKLVGQCVALAPRQQVSVDGDGCGESGEERECHAEPEGNIDESGVHGSGAEEHDEVVHDLHGHDRQRVSGQYDAPGGRQPHAGLDQGKGGEQVAEEKGQCHRDRNRGEAGEPGCGCDDEAGDLPDRTPGQAVQCRADRQPRRLRVSSPSRGVAVPPVAVPVMEPGRIESSSCHGLS